MVSCAHEVHFAFFTQIPFWVANCRIAIKLPWAWLPWIPGPKLGTALPRGLLDLSGGNCAGQGKRLKFSRSDGNPKALNLQHSRLPRVPKILTWPCAKKISQAKPSRRFPRPTHSYIMLINFFGPPTAGSDRCYTTFDPTRNRHQVGGCTKQVPLGKLGWFHTQLMHTYYLLLLHLLSIH